MEVTEPEIVIDVILLHPENAPSPMEVTESEIIQCPLSFLLFLYLFAGIIPLSGSVKWLIIISNIPGSYAFNIISK